MGPTKIERDRQHLRWDPRGSEGRIGLRRGRGDKEGRTGLRWGQGDSERQTGHEEGLRGLSTG